MRKLLFLLFITALGACKPFDAPEQTDSVINTSDKTIDELVIPDGFKFETSRKVNISITAKDNNGQILKNIPLRLYFKKENSSDTLFLMSGRLNTEGVFESTLELGTDVSTIVATTNYIGLPSVQEFDITSTTNLKVVLGETNNINLPYKFVETEERGVQETLGPDAALFTYMGTYDGNGVPRYLLPKNDVVSQDLLNTINASLPEGTPLHVSHPEYLTAGINSNISLKDSAEVWVTFVHEGAGYRNALGYYSYPTNNPPTSPSQIQNLNIIFPNASFSGSGGGLRTGNKVSLGAFKAGTTVAWFIVPNGWKSTQKIVSDQQFPIHYSDKHLNTFTTASNRQHIVSLLDPVKQLVIVGFEDIARPNGDQDFNDAVFYATANPFTAIETTNMSRTTVVAPDSDGDGVPDNQDIEPRNNAVAYYNYATGQNQYYTLAFEDFWPKKGDYDMNDLVVDYNLLEKLNAANKITQLKFNFTLRAMGAGYRNGFGIELPVTPDKVASVEGCKITENYISRSGNGTEAGQSKAVFIAFDNGYNLMGSNASSYVNTQKDAQGINNYSFDVTVTFNSGITRAELGTAPFNPFLICNKERGREVHLPGKTPTSLANTALFKTEDDDTGSSKFYQTKRNQPWAIHLTTSFEYPIEKTPVNQAYLKFNNWVESAGTTYPDWYQNKTDYRQPVKIY